MSTLAVSCPNCGKGLNVPAQLAGKTIRCKDCQQTFAVPGPAAPPAPARPAAAAKPAPARPVAAKPAAAKPADAPIPFKEDPPPPPPARSAGVDDDDLNPYGLTADDSDVPRCPFCAKELDPPDTKICLNCGYDMIGRRRHESKKVYEATAADWALHLAPGIASAVAFALVLTVLVLCTLNMREWMTDGIFDQGEKDQITGNQKFYISPYCFNIWIGLVCTWLLWVSGKFAVRRLAFNYRPEEKVKK